MNGGSPRTVVGWWSWRDNTMDATQLRIVCHHRRQTHRLSQIVFGWTDREGSPRRCGLIGASMGSIFAEKVLSGWDAVITNPAKSGEA